MQIDQRSMSLPNCHTQCASITGDLFFDLEKNLLKSNGMQIIEAMLTSKILGYWLSICAIFFLAHEARAEAEQHLFILSGQSNMRGDLPVSFQECVGKVFGGGKCDRHNRRQTQSRTTLSFHGLMSKSQLTFMNLL